MAGETFSRDARKQSVYMPKGMIDEITSEADRQDRSISWIIQQAWKIARDQIKAIPSIPKVD